jgi:hypothetical protein
MVILATVVGMRFRKTGISRRSLAEMRSPGEVELKVILFFWCEISSADS